MESPPRLTVLPEGYAEVLAERASTLRREMAQILVTPMPLTLEVGCGHGHFLTAYAQANPQKLCVGIDIVGERIDRAQRKRDRARVDNLHFLRTEANLFLNTLARTSSIAEIFILFPDPWPKARHHKHRILQDSFLATTADTMVPEGRLCFRTDYRPYFDESIAKLGRHPRWNVVPEQWPFEYTTVFQSRASEYYSIVARTKPQALSHKTAGGNPRAS